MRRRRPIAVALALLAGLQMLLPTPLFAQEVPTVPPVPTILPEESPSPSPSPSSSPSPKKKKSPTAKATPNPQADGPEAGPAKKKKKGDKEAEAPPFRLSGPNNTAELVALLRQLTKLGIPLKRALLSGTGRLPVAGLAYWYDDWHAPRCCPYPHLHKGLDVFAPMNAPALAVADGTITRLTNGEISGKAIYLTDEHGTYYFYGHMSKFADGLREGQRVRVGDVIGHVGNTGNAVGTPPHIHFEIHPGGGPAVPPKPYVDRWLRNALRDARALLARKADEIEVAERVDYRLRRSFDLAGEGGAVQASAQQLLFLAGLQPAVSSFEMARQTLRQMAWEIDWADLADAELAELARRVAALHTERGAFSVAPWGPFGPTLVSADEAYGDAPEGD